MILSYSFQNEVIVSQPQNAYCLPFLLYETNSDRLKNNS
jgi:hypothetical protein